MGAVPKRYRSAFGKALLMKGVYLPEEAGAALDRNIVLATEDMSPSARREFVRQQGADLIKAFGMGQWTRRQTKGLRKGEGHGPAFGVLSADPVSDSGQHQSVYVIGAAGHPTKIGIALDPVQRLRDIQVGCPHRLRLYFAEPIPSGARLIEKACHARLSDHRVSGEWFSIDADTAIETVRRMIAERA